MPGVYTSSYGSLPNSSFEECEKNRHSKTTCTDLCHVRNGLRHIKTAPSKFGDLGHLMLGGALGHISLSVASRACLAILSRDILHTLPNQRIWDLSIWRRYDFTFRVLRNSKLRTLSGSVSLLILHKNTISCICTWGEDRKKNRQRNDAFAVFESTWAPVFLTQRYNGQAGVRLLF